MSDSRHTYGYQRNSPLGALITSTVLLAGMIVVLYQAVPRLQDLNGFADYRTGHGRSLNESVGS